MSVTEVGNLPIEISLGGRKFKVRQLSLRQIFGISERKIISDCHRDIETIGKSLIGKIQLDYLLAATKNIPKGSELNELANEYAQTPIGLSELLLVCINNEFQKVEESELAQILSNSTEQEQIALMSYVSGVNTEAKVEEDKKK